MRRELDLVVPKALGHLRESRVQDAPRIDHFTLVRDPGAALAAARARPKISLRFFPRSFLHPPGAADLPLQRHPVDDESGLRVRVELAPFAAVIVGEKNETA